MVRRLPAPIGFVPWNPGRKNSPGWVEDGRGCHIWLGVRNDCGYGQVNAGGRKQYVHRVRYEREIGPIPTGMVLDHFICDNGSGGCCNPHHCRPVSQRENVLRGDSFLSRNLARTHCVHGHPLSGENLYTRSNGGRQCRICRAAAMLRFWERHPDYARDRRGAAGVEALARAA